MEEFRRKIAGKVYTVEEPTIRQNNAFLKLGIENKIAFSEIGQQFDFGKFLIACVEDDLLARMVQTMIVQEHTVWSAEGVPLEVCEQLTDSEIEKVFKVFFSKKKEWITYFLQITGKMMTQLLSEMAVTNYKTK